MAAPELAEDSTPGPDTSNRPGDRIGPLDGSGWVYAENFATGYSTHTRERNPSFFTRTSPSEEQVNHIVKTLESDPHELQWALLDQHRLMLVAGGERAGKSFLSGLFGATRTAYGKRFWIQAPTYELARPEFGYWLETVQRLGGIRSDRDVSAPKVGKASFKTKTGEFVETRTADDVAKLAAVAPDGILMCEAAQQPYEAYLRAVGRLAERRGWLLMSGTFEGSVGWYADKYNEWRDPTNNEGGVAYSIPSWANRHIYPGGRQDPEILRLEMLYKTVEGLFEERLGAVPVPPAFLIFREFRYTVHVRDHVIYDPAKPVYLAIDPSDGGNPYAVLAVQFHADPYWDTIPEWDRVDPIDYAYVIDEVYLQGKIGEEVIEFCQTKKWWKNVRGGAIDHEAPDERTRWMRYGKVPLRSQRIMQLQGIRRLKSFLYYERSASTGLVTRPPHLQIAPHTSSLPFEFGKFRRNPPKDDDHPVRELPPKDQFNHSVKALWYLLISRYGDVQRGYQRKPVRTWSRRK